MTYKLTLRDRLVLIDIMPTQGSLLDMIMVRSIRNTIDPTPQDIEKYNIRQSDNGLVWDNSRDVGEDFHLSESEVMFIQQQFAYWDHNNQFKLDWLDTYNLFK